MYGRGGDRQRDPRLPETDTQTVRRKKKKIQRKGDTNEKNSPNFLISHPRLSHPNFALCPSSPSRLGRVPRQQSIPSDPLPHLSQVVPRLPPFSPPSGRRARDARSRAGSGLGGVRWRGGCGRGQGSAASVPPPPPLTWPPALPPAQPAGLRAGTTREKRKLFFP